MTSSVDGARPLSGLRIVELASYVAGPLGGMTLAQLGADVIRVDMPGGGPDFRRWPVSARGESMYWAGLNKGKRSVCVNWRSDEGANLVARLVSDSGPNGGILLTNTLGVGPLAFETLAASRQDLIHVAIVGKRDGSPAVDYTVNASIGIPSITGPDESPTLPVNHVVPVWDLCCGLYAAIAILSALRARETLSSAQSVAIALEDVALATIGNLGLVAEAEMNKVVRKPIGNDVYGTLGRDFVTADGVRYMVVALTSRHWKDLMRATGLIDPINELETSTKADFSREGDRFVHRRAIFELLGAWFASHDARQVVAAFEGCSTLISQYREITDLVGPNDELAMNSVFSRIDQPGIGNHWAPASPVRWVGEPNEAERAPILGEHTDAVLREWLDLDGAEVDQLHAAGVVGARDSRR